MEVKAEGVSHKNYRDTNSRVYSFTSKSAQWWLLCNLSILPPVILEARTKEAIMVFFSGSGGGLSSAPSAVYQ